MKKCVLNWAQGHGSGPVIDQNVEALAWHLDEDPKVINHLLWAFPNANLTGQDRQIYNNSPECNGWEVSRRICNLIFAKFEIRSELRLASPTFLQFWRNEIPTTDSIARLVACFFDRMISRM